MDDSLKKFIEGMPKIELHLHIEGTLEPELAFKLAERNGLAFDYNPAKPKNKVTVRSKDAPPEAGSTELKSAEELRALYKFNNLQEFLDVYYAGMGTLKTKEDFSALTEAYLEKVDSQNVKHVEIFFDPQEHMALAEPQNKEARVARLEAAINGIREALDKYKSKGISSKLIFSFVRHRSEAEAIQCLEDAVPFMDKIDGFGLDSSELGNPPEKFTSLYKKLHEIGKPVMAHAGEEGPPDYVKQAVDMLNVNRIDHGNRSLENPELVQRLADMKMGLTVCPLSNLKLCGVKDMKDHPMKRMLDAGLKVSCNSDDPAYFGGYMNENFMAVAFALGLTQQDIVKLAGNAIDTSFLSPDEKKAKHEELKAYVTRFRFINPNEGKALAAG